MRIHVPLAALGIALAPAATHAQHIIGTRDARALRADSVFRAFDRTDSPGCALGVYENNAILYARGYGMASLENGVSLSPRSVLDVGSISKQFTAMAILLLQQDGKLSIDDPIRKYIPEMAAYGDKVTIRRALSQTSGIRDLYILMAQTGRFHRGDSVDALRLITRSAEPNFEPGERYLYSNSGWILAAQIVYRLTGKSLAQFAQERIFAPLGMNDTRYLGDASLVIPNLATAYSPRGGSAFAVARSGYDGSIMGAGGVHTTIEDFGRWLANYESLVVGSREIVSTMTTATRLNDGSPATASWTTAYAVGLSVGTLRGLPIVSHGGSWAGYRGHFIRFPEQRFAVATFCNLSNSGPDSLARKVAGIYLGDRMHPDSAALFVAGLTAAPERPMTAEALRPLVGVWRHVGRGEVRRTRLVGDTLFSVTGQRTRMEPIGDGRFRVGDDAEVRFDAADMSPASRMSIRTAADTVTFVRADSVALTPAQLAAFAGEYRSDEVEATHSWRIERDQLVLYIGNRRQGTLEPSYRDGFTRGTTVIDVQRDGRGRISGFVIQAGRVRNLRFTRVP
jgi:CubicO group peptidase (beta-lactamase class C family)